MNLRRFFRRVASLGLVTVVAGCASGQLAAPVGTPVADPAPFAATLIAGSQPSTPQQQINFGWTLAEGGSRVRGQGVVRVQTPGRIRLDLFGLRGETYLMAALVDGEFRLPSAARAAVALPSPTLLWGALGVVAPPPDGILRTANETGDGAELRYETSAGETFVYRFQGSAAASYDLVSLERAGSRGVLETISVSRGSDGAITQTTYRDWQAFRDLTLDITEIQPASSFPSSIWNPDAPTP
jgi:hypothetical protein